MSNIWLDLELSRFSFLQPLAAVGIERVKAWLPESESAAIKRASADGTWLLRVSGGLQEVAVLWSDFRINGGSFGGEVSCRIAEFLHECEQRRLPLILVINSLGYRFMDGRHVFDQVFNLVPALERYSRQQLVISICHGLCLGLGAILFGMGHYRIGVRDESTLLNLTGPDVFRLFFGSKVDFASFASLDHQHQKTAMVHERVVDLDQALQHAFRLARITRGAEHIPAVQLAEENDSILDFLARQHQRTERACQALLKPISDRHLQLFAGFDSRLRVYLVESESCLFGLLMNPVDNTNNMVTVRTLKLYQEALALFKAMRIPVVSFLDTPGVDPRVDNNNQDIIRQLIDTNRAIIDYPFPKMGVWIGRGFGGANTLIMPRVYGSHATYVILERTTLGVMHESIIEHLLEKSKRLLGLWREARQNEAADFQDLVDAGVVTRAIHLHELRDVIRAFLLGQISNETELEPDAMQAEEVCV